MPHQVNVSALDTDTLAQHGIQVSKNMRIMDVANSGSSFYSCTLNGQSLEQFVGRLRQICDGLTGIVLNELYAWNNAVPERIEKSIPIHFRLDLYGFLETNVEIGINLSADGMIDLFCRHPLSNANAPWNRLCTLDGVSGRQNCSAGLAVALAPHEVQSTQILSLIDLLQKGITVIRELIGKIIGTEKSRKISNAPQLVQMGRNVVPLPQSS
ncbi:hypothetical protein HZA38_03200 [Candidatus Peregrinibacteria bacterium]|nr:hypothetical protein [Candidatus Peregrinibacteria bacterium]